ncbi:TetR/AcrR family transcriptional regulator [Myceligenerans pegani]|uniref:TetR/AcrR family transcriptional regulator n=1 Tax=Myceligenerans pegani TaxID=2776917 RepID=A0ABR9MVZ9_9MICO|nr:TetR/AcrR family transcriptional regulator [Myceligenerans sp. TRM 65318]MBE1875567.1 TetR/AcrR family transcriptional regulator [Myceligenerans sp. TRM 65318]MBE3017838.1 TetR/AcrR family transcriptional regulator [Myceligenerans sp. TRM 65318]
MSAHTPPVLLPVAGQPPRERADAARNRSRLLDVAARLVAEHGAANVTMDAVAAGAAVGKGTVYRRFGDRAGLMLALLDHAGRAFQEAFISGPPPLGPGAPPTDRLRAFGAGLIEHHLRYRDLYLAAELPPDRRYTDDPPRALYARHISGLLAAAETGGDTELLTETLLASLDPALLAHLRAQRGMSQERITAGWTDLVDRLLG